MGSQPTSIVQSYDRIAEIYAERYFEELDQKPLDRALLALFADEVRGRGKVIDIGTGPGQVARALHALGVDVIGLDASPAMVAAARRLTPALEFVEGSFRELPVGDGALAGITAFYALVHVPREELAGVLAELHRALRRGGWLLFAFHIGRGTLHVDTLLGARVDLDYVLLETDEVLGALREAGFTPETQVERMPYAAIEHDTQRGYVLARKR